MEKHKEHKEKRSFGSDGIESECLDCGRLGDDETRLKRQHYLLWHHRWIAQKAECDIPKMQALLEDERQEEDMRLREIERLVAAKNGEADG